MLGRHIQTAFENSSVDVVSVSRAGDNLSTHWDLGKWLNSEELDNMFSSTQAVVHAGAFVQSFGDLLAQSVPDANPGATPRPPSGSGCSASV